MKDSPLERAMEALYICPACKTTIHGRNIPSTPRTLAIGGPGGLVTFFCACDRAVLEPIEEF